MTLAGSRVSHITFSLPRHRGGDPGVEGCSASLEPDGSCLAAGLTVDGALISVNGKAVNGHKHAIELLEAANVMTEQERELGPTVFEAVFRATRSSERAEVIQSL